MFKPNRVQRNLLSLGYPVSIVKEYKQNSKHYREEVKDYVYDTLVERRRQLSDHNNK